MREWLCVFLVLATASASSASMVWIDQADIPVDPLSPSDDVVIAVYTDTPLLGLDCILRIESGPGCIVDALNPDYPPFCFWPPTFIYDPVINCNAVEIGAGNFAGTPGPVVGWFLVHCEGYGEVTATLLAATGYGGSMDISYGVPTITGTITIYQVPEPITIAIVDLGGLALLRRRKE